MTITEKKENTIAIYTQSSKTNGKWIDTIGKHIGWSCEIEN